MDLANLIGEANSKIKVDIVVDEIDGDATKFAVLMDLFFSPDPQVNWRAAWIMSHCVERHRWQVKPYLAKMIKHLYKKNTNDATRRSIVRTLQLIDIPEKLHGETIEICFRFLTGAEAVAIKVFSMTVLFNLCQFVPEISYELKLSIEDQMTYGSSGFRNRGEKILKALARLY